MHRIFDKSLLPLGKPSALCILAVSKALAVTMSKLRLRASWGKETTPISGEGRRP